MPAGDIEAMRAAISPKTAAVLVECIQGEGGVNPLSQEYVTALAALCKEKDILFMCDEVQCGMCRSGRFWAFQNYGVEPAVFTCSKALANGLPMGAVLAANAVAAGFVPGAHATAFGGGALVSAAAAKTIAIMQGDRLAERAARMGDFAMALFEDVKTQCPGKIETVRGMGLMLGIVLTFPGADVWKKLLERGFVLNLTQGNVLRLLPPLVIEQEDLKLFAAALADVLGEV